MPTTRYVNYLRVSTTQQEQEGASLDDQRDLLLAYAKRKGMQVVHEYKDASSSWTGTRDQYDQMLEDARQRQFDGILVWKLDRFGRRSGQIHSAIEELSALDINLIIVSENVNLTQGGIVGKVLTSALALTADLENEMRADRSRRVHERRRELGLFTGSIPSGYRYTGKYQPAEIDPDVAPGIERAFELYATGRYSIMDVAQMLNDTGYYLASGKAFHLRNLRQVLTNRRYTGQILIDGQWVASREPVIVSEDLFDRVQRIMAKRHGAPRSAARSFKPYLLKGILYCLHCGRRMYSQRTGQRKFRIPYYRCSSTHHLSGGCIVDDRVPAVMIREDTLAPQVDQIVDNMRLPDAWKEKVMAYLGHDRNDEIRRRRAKLKVKLNRLNDLYVDEFIDKAEFSRRHRQYQDALVQLIVPDQAVVMSAGRRLEDIRQYWRTASLKRKNELLKTVFDKMKVDRFLQEIVVFEIYPEFDALFRQMESMRPRGDEEFSFVFQHLGLHKCGNTTRPDC